MTQKLTLDVRVLAFFKDNQSVLPAGQHSEKSIEVWG
jgi:hypothetical protein